jgi:Asp-tRNA(Asn)/Glu-tRNA(Gln) amidotransferase A subunit family amidase
MIPPTIHTAAEAIRRGELSPVDLLEACLVRVDRHEARVRAWVFVDRERARAEARARAEEVKAGQWRGPLHGIPVGIKDIFDVFDWPTAAGSRLWKDSVARHDATVVARLRQAGAVLVGKTVTTQYASFDPPPTRNPWGEACTPGGSSSGSAAAVACGMCLAALGSQTGGSITRPATYCGVAGCKPTWGRVSTHGVVPLAPSMDHVGPIARTVHDLAVVLEAIAGRDERDPFSSPEPAENWSRCCPPGRRAHHAGRPFRLGRVRGLFDDLADSSVRQMMDEVCARLGETGVEIDEVALPAAFAEVIPRHRVVMAVEAAAYHRERLARHPDDYGPCIRGLLEEGLACPAPEYAACKEHQRSLREQVLSCLEGVDALVMPATTGAAPPADTTGDPAFNSPWSYTGLPSVSIPTVRTPDRLPLGVQFVGLPFREADLFTCAAWCERELGFEQEEEF